MYQRGDTASRFIGERCILERIYVLEKGYDIRIHRSEMYPRGDLCNEEGKDVSEMGIGMYQ